MLFQDRSPSSFHSPPKLHMQFDQLPPLAREKQLSQIHSYKIQQTLKKTEKKTSTYLFFWQPGQYDLPELSTSTTS